MTTPMQLPFAWFTALEVALRLSLGKASFAVPVGHTPRRSQILKND